MIKNRKEIISDIFNILKRAYIQQKTIQIFIYYSVDLNEAEVATSVDSHLKQYFYPLYNANFKNNEEVFSSISELMESVPDNIKETNNFYKWLKKNQFNNLQKLYKEYFSENELSELSKKIVGNFEKKINYIENKIYKCMIKCYEEDKVLIDFVESDDIYACFFQSKINKLLNDNGWFNWLDAYRKILDIIVEALNLRAFNVTDEWYDTELFYSVSEEPVKEFIRVEYTKDDRTSYSEEEIKDMIEEVSDTEEYEYNDQITETKEG